MPAVQEIQAAFLERLLARCNELTQEVAALKNGCLPCPRCGKVDCHWMYVRRKKSGLSKLLYLEKLKTEHLESQLAEAKDMLSRQNEEAPCQSSK